MNVGCILILFKTNNIDFSGIGDNTFILLIMSNRDNIRNLIYEIVHFLQAYKAIIRIFH